MGQGGNPWELKRSLLWGPEVHQNWVRTTTARPLDKRGQPHYWKYPEKVPRVVSVSHCTVREDGQ